MTAAAARLRLFPLLRASHAQPAAAVTAITTALAVAAGRGRGALAVAAAVLAGQLSVGWSNDWIDRERDSRAGRTDKPLVAGEVSSAVVRAGALVALAACVPLSLLSGWRAALVHLAAVAAAWGYNLGLKATAASVVPYAVAFGLLPAFVTLGLAGHPWPPAWAMLASALLGAGAHFVNTLPDLAADVALGVRGLPQRFGARASLLLGAGLLAASAALVALAPAGSPGVGAVVLLAVALAGVAGVAAAAVTGKGRAAWSLTLAVAGLTVALFLVQGGSLTA